MYGIHFEVARITIEFRTAFAVGTGEGDGLHDAVFATDANGLPAIPGDSIAGVLRHAFAAGNPESEDLRQRAFGYQDRDGGKASPIRVSWAHVHGANNQPVPFRGAASDDVTLFLAGGVMRDHVRIGANGTAEDAGKFDEILVPAGARFTFEIIVDSSGLPGVSISDLVALLRSPVVRIGHGTRHGLGEFDVIAVRSRTFDLTNAEDRSRWAKYPVSLNAPDSVLQPMTLSNPESQPAPGWAVGKITLRPMDTWVIGGSLHSDPDANLSRFPLTERRIHWRADRGVVETETDMARAALLVPGTAVKGALRHRTAFHLRRLAQRWLPTNATPDDHRLAEEPMPGELELFGSIKSSGSSSPGQPARVSVADGWVNRDEVRPARLQHVSLDRFTQGPMDGLLFAEEVLLGGALTLHVAIETRHVTQDGLMALRAALDDLGRGRLTIGAGRGHGRFEVVDENWSDRALFNRGGV